MSNSNQRLPNRFSITVPMLLVLLSLAVIAPLVLFSIYSLDRFAEGVTKLEFDTIKGRSVSISASVDREISGMIAIGNALAASPSLPANDLKAFHAEAQQAIRGSNTNILLLDTTLQQIINTRVAFGTPLPTVSEPQVSMRAMETNGPTVSNTFVGKVAKRLVFNVALPVQISGQTRFVLLVTDEPALISSVLQQQGLPEFWKATVRDGIGKTFATSGKGIDPETWHFQLPASEQNGILQDHVINNEVSFAAFYKSALTGWTTTVWVPQKVLSKPIDELRSMLLRAGLLATAVSILISYAYSRPFANLIQQIVATVSRVGGNAALPPINSILREGQTIEASLLRTDLELRENQQRLILVMRELTHRAKNLLAVILSIATQTAKKNTTLDEFLQVFAKRVQGLGTSHDLLVKSDWRGVLLGDLIVAQMSPFGGVDNRRITATGPELLLKPDVLQALGLAFHELATNAVKYGALSLDKGSVTIKWEIDRSAQKEIFRMTWTEKNGPLVKKPAQNGFGHVIVVKSLAATINGQVDIAFEPKGVIWTMVTPLASIIFDRG